jgi:uncharacterized protein (TIGR02231 family)
MTTPLETTITAVTVYPDRARVTRRGQISAEPAQYRLEIPELPLALSPESVRVSGRGTARARLGGVDVRRAFYTETPSTTAAELERRIKEIGDQETALTDEESVLKASLDFLNGLAQQGESYGKGLAYGKFSVKESTELLEFLNERTTAAQDRRRAIAVAKRELAREKEKFQRELKQIHSARPRERYAAIIELEAFTAGDLDIELTYVVGKASWTPLYDMRLTEGNEGDESEEPGVEISYLAQVTQRSGEDWSGVNLTLSTARPALSATLPELSPWYVQVYYPPPPVLAAAGAGAGLALRKGARFAKEGAVAPAADIDFLAEPAKPPMEVKVAQAEVGQEGAAVTFTVAQPTDVPSDGSPHKTAVATLSLTPKLDYLTAPKLVPAAYRRATVTNDTELILLPGPANIFYGDEFVGTTQLKHVAPTEEFKVFLGADDRIKVERKLVTRQVDKRLLGDRRRLRYAYQIEVKNLRQRAEKVFVQDQLPVSGHEEIKVREEEIVPRPDKKTDLGILEWELTLEPGQETKLTFEFTVDHPRNLTVTGLPEV